MARTLPSFNSRLQNTSLQEMFLLEGRSLMHLRSVRPTSSRRDENLDVLVDLDLDVLVDECFPLTIVSSLLPLDMKCRVFVFVFVFSKAAAGVLVLVERRRAGVWKASTSMFIPEQRSATPIANLTLVDSGIMIYVL